MALHSHRIQTQLSLAEIVCAVLLCSVLGDQNCFVGMSFDFKRHVSIVLLLVLSVTLPQRCYPQGVSFIAFFCFMMCANLFGMYSLATRLGSSREQGWTDVWFGAAWWMYSTISFFALAVGSYNAGWKLYRMGVYGPKWWRTMLLGGGCHRACCGEAAPEEEV